MSGQWRVAPHMSGSTGSLGATATRAVWAGVGLYTVLIAVAWIAGGLLDPSLFIVGAVLVVIVLAFGGVGGVLSIRLPRNPVGWILWSTGAITAVSIAGNTYAQWSMQTLDGRLPGTAAVAFIAFADLVPLLALLGICLPLVFPTGSLPSPRWRWVAQLSAVAVAAATVISAITPGPMNAGPDLVNPIGVEALGRLPLSPGDLITVLMVGPFLAAVASVFARYRTAQAVERAQLRWFGAAVLAMIVAIVAGTSGIGPMVEAGWLVMLAGLTLLPIAIGIAVLRYRLYEIDRIISRTIGWAIVSGLLVGAFVLLVLGLTAVLEPLTGGNTLAIAGSTLVVAALFTPVRSRVQRLVDRRFDRSRYDGQRLLAVFGERLRDEVDLPTIRSEVLATVDAAVRPSGAGLWLRRPDAEGGA